MSINLMLEDEEQAVAALIALLKDGFGELG
jgi:phosphotransferase system HPr-like phosphotransfer protein